MENFSDKLNELHNEFKNAIDRKDEAATQRLNDAMSDIEAKMKAFEAASNRPSIEGDNANEIKSFMDFARGKISEAEYKAVSGSVSSEGGVTIPKVIDSAILAALVDVSPIRQVARVISVPTTDFHIPFSPTGAQSGWVSEKASRPETGEPTFTEVIPSFGELYANAMVTQQILDDSQFDMAGFVSNAVAIEFARAEGAAFVSGTGTNQPKGFLAATTAATVDASRAFGTVQYIPSGAAAAMPTSPDVFINMVMSLKAGYRTGSSWLMSKAVLGAIRQYKDSTGQYLWQPSLVAGAPSTFLGYPVVEAEDMPAVAAGNYPIAFGNWNAGYVIADRIGTRTLRDPYSNKPFINFYTTKRVGGCMVDSAAIKLLKIAAS